MNSTDVYVRACLQVTRGFINGGSEGMKQITDIDRAKLNINKLYAYAIISYIVVMKLIAILSSDPGQVDAVFSNSSYALIALFVWVKINDLSEVHLERGILILLVVFGFIFRKLGIPIEVYLFPVRWLSSFAIMIALIKGWNNIPRTRPQWLGVGLIASIPVLAITIMIETFQPQPWIYANPYPSNNILFETIRKIIFELSYVTILEEIIFRGLIWGFLIQAGWSENKVLWVQAVLFWILHFTKTPITFIITIPLITVLFSMLTKYSKQVFPSVLAHTAINAMTPIILYFYIK